MVDLLLIGACVAGLVHGTWKGASWQLAGFGTLIGALVLGRPLSAAIAPLLGESGAFTGFLAWAIVYGVIAFACFLLAVRLRHRLRDWELQKWDSHVGGMLGVVNGVLVWSVVMMFVVALAPSARTSVLDRPSGKVLGYTLGALHGVLPDGVHDITHPLMHPIVGEQPADEKRAEQGETTHRSHGEGEAATGGSDPAPAPAPAPTPVPGDHDH